MIRRNRLGAIAHPRRKDFVRCGDNNSYQRPLFDCFGDDKPHVPGAVYAVCGVWAVLRENDLSNIPVARSEQRLECGV